MPLSLSSSSLNSSRYDSKSLRCTSCSQCSEAVLTAILIKVLYQNALDLTCSFLCTYFGRCQIHLPPVKHLFLSNCCDSNLGSFFHGIRNFLRLPMVFTAYVFHVQLVVKFIFQFWLCLFQFFPTFRLLIWIYTFYNHQTKCFMLASILAG